jgi:phage-related protein
VNFPTHVVEQLPGMLSSVLAAINEWIDGILPRMVSKGEQIGSSILSGITHGLGKFAGDVIGGVGSIFGGGGGSTGGGGTTGVWYNGHYYAPGDTFHYASGTDNAPGGLSWVGENGPELVNLPGGAQVFTADQSRRMAAGNGGDTINVYVGGSITTARGMAEDVRTELLRMKRQGIDLGFT